MKSNFVRLLILSVFMFSASCNMPHEVKISEINTECKQLSDFNLKTGEGFSHVIIEGYLVGANKPSDGSPNGPTTEINISDTPDNIKNSVWVSFTVGTENNQLFEFIDNNNFTVKTSTGDFARVKDKIRLLVALAKHRTGRDSFHCSLIGSRVDKL